MIYYHYTDKHGYEEISRTNEFKPSYFSQALDATYGPGWYFTDLTPDKADDELYELWGGVAESDKTKYYIEFDIDPDVLQHCRPHVWRMEPDKISDDHINIKGAYRNDQNKLVLMVKRMGNRLRDFFHRRR